MRDFRKTINRLLSLLAKLWARPKIRYTVQGVWTAIIVLFITLAIAANWQTISSIDWTLEKLSILGLATLVALLRRFAGAVRWVAVILLLDSRHLINIRQSLKVYFLSNLASYLPGTYWFIPSRIVMHSRYGIGALQTSASIVLEQFLLVLSGAMLSVLGIHFVTTMLNLPVSTFVAILSMVGIGLIAIHPWVISKAFDLLTYLLRIDRVKISLRYEQLLLLLLWSILIWLLGAASLLLQVHAFVPQEINIEQIGIFGAIFAVSWLIGYFTPFAPNGFGVREGAIAIALRALGVPLELSVLIVVLSRLLTVIEDLFWAAVSVVL